VDEYESELERLDRLIRELEPLAEQTHDLETIVAIRHVIERHGSGPYPPEDLAALTGVDVAGVQRALDEMVRAGPLRLPLLRVSRDHAGSAYRRDPGT
jgi:DNA-binding MarR family transcriptional regulator